jgi:hypothetical protein
MREADRLQAEARACYHERQLEKDPGERERLLWRMVHLWEKVERLQQQRRS